MIEITSSEFSGMRVEERMRVFRSGSIKTRMSPRERLLMMLMFGRPRTAIPGVLAFALGVAYVQDEFSMRAAAIAFLMFMCAFLANMLNTWTDVEEDIRNLPGRVYLLSAYGFRELKWTTHAICVLMLAVAATLGLPALIGMLCCMFVIYQYSVRPVLAKKRPIVGLIMFSQAVLLPFLMGSVVEPDAAFVFVIWDYITGHATVPEAQRAVRFLGMAGFLFVWFVAKGMYKNIPDYHGDRDAGVRTSASVFPTRRSAALAAAAATIAAYLLLVPLILLGYEEPVVALSLLWLVPVSWNCCRLVRADSTAMSNQCLGLDMIISTGFVATLLCLVQPAVHSFVLIALGFVIIIASDLLKIDTRRRDDVAHEAN